jgi:hypothetical protein
MNKALLQTEALILRIVLNYTAIIFELPANRQVPQAQRPNTPPA